MALPQAYARDVGGTIDFYAPVRPGSNPVVQVINDGGSLQIASTAATVDPVNTTITAAATSGDRTLTVASIASVVSGRRYRLGPADPATSAAPHEFITVESATGTTLTLLRPVRRSHASGVPLAGTRMSLAVTAAQATALFWDGEAVWSWDSMAPYTPFTTPVECVRRVIQRTCAEEDVGVWDPLLLDSLPPEQSPTLLLDSAFETVLHRIGGRFRAQTMRGSAAFVKPTALRFVLETRIQSRAAEQEIARWRDAYEESIADLLGIFAADLDQDAAIEDHEGPITTGRVDRG